MAPVITHHGGRRAATARVPRHGVHVTRSPAVPVAALVPAAEEPAGVTGRAARRRSPVDSPVFLGACGLLGLVAAFEVLPRAGVLDRRLFPTSSEIAVALVDQVQQSEFWLALWDTLRGWALGLAIAAVAGIVLGIVIGSSRLLREITASTIEFVRPIPSVALIPLAVLLFGVKIESTLMLVVYASFWQVFIQVLYGVADVDNVAMQTAKSYGLGSMARVRHVVFPTALPYLMTGIRLAASVALILAITAEMFIGNPGLGRAIMIARESQQWTTVYALVVVTGMLGLLINLVFRGIERRSLSWHQSVRGEEVL